MSEKEMTKEEAKVKAKQIMGMKETTSLIAAVLTGTFALLNHAIKTKGLMEVVGDIQEMNPPLPQELNGKESMDKAYESLMDLMEDLCEEMRKKTISGAESIKDITNLLRKGGFGGII
jgi:hypothetical protein